MPKRIFKDEGEIIGSLIFIRETGVNRNKKRTALFRCRCGVEFEAVIASAVSGNTKSCGCYEKEQASIRSRKHGMRHSAEYAIWCGIKKRCYNPKDINYKNYGSKGIKVCEKWVNDFAAFFKDLGFRPSHKHSVERIDSKGDYEPNNCRWATSVEQNRNRRNNHLVSYNGATMCITEWEEKLGMKRGVLQSRIVEYKWEVEKAITTQVRRR